MCLADVCVKRRAFTAMLVAALVIAEWFTCNRRGPDLPSQIGFPPCAITTILVAVSPEEIEAQGSNPIEVGVNTVSGLEEFRPNATEHALRVTSVFARARGSEYATYSIGGRIFPKSAAASRVSPRRLGQVLGIVAVSQPLGGDHRHAGYEAPSRLHQLLVARSPASELAERATADE